MAMITTATTRKNAGPNQLRNVVPAHSLAKSRNALFVSVER